MCPNLKLVIFIFCLFQLTSASYSQNHDYSVSVVLTGRSVANNICFSTYDVTYTGKSGWTYFPAIYWCPYFSGSGCGNGNAYDISDGNPQTSSIQSISPAPCGEIEGEFRLLERENSGDDLQLVWSKPFTLSGTDLVLPVKYGAIIIDRQGDYNIVLRWNTLIEINNTGWEVEHSLEGTEWKKIGFVPGKVRSQKELEYNFTYRLNSSGRQYFRLKQIDFDGHYSYSDVRYIDLDVNNLREYKLWPNPVTDALYVDGETVPEKVMVYDMAGRKVFSVERERTLDLKTLRPGTYMVLIYGENGRRKYSRILKM